MSGAWRRASGILPAALALALAALAAAATCRARAAGEENGALKERIRQKDREIASVRAERLHRDTVYVERLRELRTTRTVHDSAIVRLVDSVVVRDTVIRWLAEERRACDLALSACEARVAAADSQAGLERARAALFEKLATQRRCRLLFIPCPSRTASVLLGVAFGAVGTAAIIRR